MKHFSQQFYKKAETTVKLQAAEKRELRERVVAYMEYHPLPADQKRKKVSPAPESTFADTFTMVKVPFHAMFKYGAVAAAFVLVVIPFLAEKAVPGDALYAVKVQFNEEVRSTLTFGGFEKVTWETERLNRRIAEARLLASEGRLTEDVEAEVVAAVKEHTENAKREIEVLREEDADEATIASIALDTTLEAQVAVLMSEEDAAVDSATSLAATSSAEPGDLIASAIEESRTETLLEVASTSSTLPAYDKLLARIEQNTTRIYELHHTLEGLLAPEELTDMSRRESDIERAIGEATALFGTDELLAREELVGVLQRTQRLIVYMTELEVVKTVDIETIVPVVLTAEEEQAMIVNATTELQARTEQIDIMLTGVNDVAVLEKALAGKDALLALSGKMASSTGDYPTFMTIADEANTLALDIVKLLEQYYNPPTEPTDLPEVAPEEVQASTTAEEVVPEEGVVEEVPTEVESGEGE